MNYRHIYHAGNFADVFKHLITIGLCQTLSQKEKPWCFLDIHAGAGLYNLNSTEAQKTQEYKLGIEKLVDSFSSDDIHSSISPILNTYFAILKEYNYPAFYPGSPLIVQHCLREKDRMILIEKHPEEVSKLKLLFKEKNYKKLKDLENEKKIIIHEQDGYLALKAFLPPKEKRGLILIDPPYESSDEWEKIIQGLEMGLKRFASGVFAVWYPIKNKTAVQDFHQALNALNHPEILIAELCVYPEDVEHGLNGCGMAIINPPWKFNLVLEELLPWLWTKLSIKKSTTQYAFWMLKSK